MADDVAKLKTRMDRIAHSQPGRPVELAQPPSLTSSFPSASGSNVYVRDEFDVTMVDVGDSSQDPDEMGRLRRTVDVLVKENERLSIELKALDSMEKGGERDANELTDILKRYGQRILETDVEKSRLQEQVVSQANEIQETNGKLSMNEAIRRELLNANRELKGYIRVFLRIRRLLDGETGFICLKSSRQATSDCRTPR